VRRALAVSAALLSSGCNACVAPITWARNERFFKQPVSPLVLKNVSAQEATAQVMARVSVRVPVSICDQLASRRVTVETTGPERLDAILERIASQAGARRITYYSQMDPGSIGVAHPFMWCAGSQPQAPLTLGSDGKWSRE
jgi:hypothetical protein